MDNKKAAEDMRDQGIDEDGDGDGPESPAESSIEANGAGLSKGVVVRREHVEYLVPMYLRDPVCRRNAIIEAHRNPIQPKCEPAPRRFVLPEIEPIRLSPRT